MIIGLVESKEEYQESNRRSPIITLLREIKHRHLEMGG